VRQRQRLLGQRLDQPQRRRDEHVEPLRAAAAKRVLRRRRRRARRLLRDAARSARGAAAIFLEGGTNPHSHAPLRAHAVLVA
jgi:hypothetical protein